MVQTAAMINTYNSDSGNNPTGCIILADGTRFLGSGFGAVGCAVGEVCFNTSMTGYQEISTDPSYAGQIVTFTFPHIGNVGATPEDCEARSPAALAIVVKWRPTEQSNWRATENLSQWMEQNQLIGVGSIDTRRLTRAIRSGGMPHAAIAFNPDGRFDFDAMRKQANDFGGLDGLDLAKDVTCSEEFDWDGSRWEWPAGYQSHKESDLRVAAIDFGAKENIMRCLTDTNASVRVFPATATAREIRAWRPDGLFLSNGPGDPAATGEYALPLIQEIVDKTDIPVFGICLGHQLLALALGANTVKMKHGHHGANHPVKDLETGKVEITSMNHGFMVDRSKLPPSLIETHISLFDGTNCGIRLRNREAFSVQFHPEASPGPQDSFYLFERFSAAMHRYRSLRLAAKIPPL